MAAKKGSSPFEKGNKMFGAVHQQNGGLVVEVELNHKLGKRWNCTEYSRISVRDGMAHYITWDLLESELFDNVDDAIEYAMSNAPKNHPNNQKAKKSS